MHKALAIQLLEKCPVNAFEDHEIIANALLSRNKPSDTLKMSEVDNWPETYVWLKSRLF